MMKVTELKQEPKFPAAYRCLRDGHQDMVVLFFSEVSGVLIAPLNHCNYGLYEDWTSCLRKATWEPVNIEITHGSE